MNFAIMIFFVVWEETFGHSVYLIKLSTPLMMRNQKVGPIATLTTVPFVRIVESSRLDNELRED